MAEQLQRVKLEGSSRDVGRAHGEELRGLVARSIELYRGWFRDVAKLDWDGVLAAAGVFVGALEHGAPNLLEEMRGIAEGAGVPFEAILAINCRTELGYGGRDQPGPTECTAVGIHAAASQDGHTYVGQNWDWRAAHLEIAVLLDIRKTNAPHLLTLTEAGMVGKIGMNERGVGLCFNLLATDVSQKGMPAHVLARKALEQPGLEQALRVVARARRACAGNFLFGFHDADAGAGEVANMQWAPPGFQLEFPANGFIARTNHFVEPVEGTSDRAMTDPELNMSTHVRLRRAKQVLGRWARGAGLGPEAMQEVFRDHYNRPYSICSHTAESEGKQSQSNASIIMDLAEQTVAYTSGPPCESEYLVVRL